MKLKYTKEEDIKMIKYLRFRNHDPATSKYTFMSLGAIGKLLNKSISYVSKRCKELS